MTSPFAPFQEGSREHQADFVAAYLIEPLVFGHRTGVSSFALLISALFWIWVWDPVGLATQHRKQKEITEEDFEFILNTTNHIIEQIRAREGSPPLEEAMFDGAGSIATQDNGLRRWSDAR